MTDDEKALVQKDLDEQKKAFQLLRAVRWLDDLSVRGMLWTKLDAVAQNINRPLEDDLIALASKLDRRAKGE